MVVAVFCPSEDRGWRRLRDKVSKSKAMKGTEGRFWFLHIRPALREDGSSLKPSLSYCGWKGHEKTRKKREVNRDEKI